MSQVGLIDIETTHPQIPTLFVTDLGNAIPIANTLEILGLNGITTSGSGNTVTASGINATTAQIGVVELATNAEAIAGTSLTVAVTPSNLPSVFASPFPIGSVAANTGKFTEVVVDNLKLDGNTLSNTATNQDLNLTTVGIGKVKISYGNAFRMPYFGVNGAIEQMNAMTNGKIPIGFTGSPPQAANITSIGATVAITNGPGSINLETGGAIPNTFTTDAGNAIPALGVLNVLGGTNIGTTGAGNNVTINLDGTTNHTVQVGNAGGSITSLVAGTTGHLLIGNTGADPSWAAYGSIFTDLANILFVGKHGNDANNGKTPNNAKLTIQAAVTAAAAGYTIIVYPGTYTETITHAANNVTLIAQGKPNTCIITQASANVVNFSTFTGIQYKYFNIRCTAATTAIWTVEGSTGECSFKECQLSMTCAANIAAVDQPGVGRVTGAGTLSLLLGKVTYYHTGNGGATAIKTAFSVADGGFVDLRLIGEIIVSNSGTALVSTVSIDLASSGNIHFNDCYVDVTDPNATFVVGFGYLGGTGIDNEFYRNEIHINATNNISYGIYCGDSATITRTFFNHIHPSDVAGASYFYHVGSTATLISVFDDNVQGDGADGNDLVAGSFFYQTNKAFRGNLTCEGPTASGTRLLTVSNTDNTATASNAAVNISVGGSTSTGDPYVNFAVTGGQAYSLGVDNSDSDILKFTTGATPSAGSTLMRLTNGGNIYVGLGDFYTQRASVAGIVECIVSNTDNTNTASDAGFYASSGGALGGDAFTNYLISGAGIYSVGIDNSDSDKFKITSGTSPSAGTDLFTMTSAGVITLNNDLDVSEGGTGVSTLTSHGILMGNGAGDIQATAEPSNGQILIGKTGDFAQLATITSGVGISVTSAAGAITIDATGAGTAYAEITDATKAMVVNTSYAANRALGVAFSLPATSAIGSVVEVIGKDGLWSITQAVGQQIFVSNQNTTNGIAGVLTATHLGDCITLRCITANTIWRATSFVGNLTYA